MRDKEKTPKDKTLLVFNCHEPWVYQLGILGYSLDIVVGLPGRYNSGWDEQMRPVPANAQLIPLRQALESPKRYYCMIVHNTTDLLDVRTRREPRILVLHHSLEGRIEEEGPGCDPEKMKEMLHTYIEFVGGHVVATSMFKGESWGFTDDIAHFGIDVNDYLPYSGEKAAGLRICNFISSRRRILDWDFHEKAFDSIPVTLVGHTTPMCQASRPHRIGNNSRESFKVIASISTPRTHDLRQVTTWPPRRPWRRDCPSWETDTPRRSSSMASVDSLATTLASCSATLECCWTTEISPL